ncbi:lasso RiPP family leader peptide-containing protein [bacterium]|nr:lasso RiPP family leader peptide-containing protein [bacterium]MCI0603098.1 lasso RiPP family leader peptide-containing protein [bacterium]
MKDREEINQKNEAKRRPYKTPKLIKYGDIRSLTLGGTPGSGDSGPGGGQEELVGSPVEQEESPSLNE